MLWVAFAGLVAYLVVRAIRRDRREYQRFKRYRTTRKRQAMYLKWLRDSILSLGGSALVLLALAGQFIAPLLAEMQAWWDREPWVGWAIVGGTTLAVAVLTVVGVLAVRGSNEVTTIGDIRAMIPRNRQEVRIGWALSLNAGISEELLFRLAVPAVVYGATGIPELAVIASVVMFGALHLYQGPLGLAAATTMGAAFLFAYVVTGSILVPIVLHVLVDLRSFVVLPMAAYGAHRIDGRTRPLITRPRATPVEQAATETSTETAVATDSPSPGSPARDESGRD